MHSLRRLEPSTDRPPQPPRPLDERPGPIRHRHFAGEAEETCSIVRSVVAIGFGPLDRPEPQPASEYAPTPVRAAALARQIAMYLTHVGFGISMAEIGRDFGRDRTTVVHACHVIEDRRDDQRFDTLLDQLEQAALALRAARRLGGRG